MTFMRKAGHLTAALAVALGLLVASAASVHAQGPYTAYGVGLAAGDTVVASVGGAECASTTADADGNWILEIESSAMCGPSDGATINFSLNGEAAEETATWTAGGTPATAGYEADTGITLTVMAMDPGTGDGDGADTGMGDGDGADTGMGDGDGADTGMGDGAAAAPGPSDTGQAGLVTSGTGTSLALLLLLGVLTASLAAGARVVTRTR